MTLIPICSLKELPDRTPFHAQMNNLDLVVIKYDNDVSVLYGRCLHRGALLSDGYIEGENLICGLHQWDYRYDTGISAYNNEERLYKFKSFIKDGELYVDTKEINNYL